MNTKRIYVMTCLLLGIISTYAQATLKIANFSISPNEVKEIAVEMDNLVEIRAFQARMVLPNGITLIGTPQLATQRLGGTTDEFGDYMASQKSLNYNLMDDGSYMFIVNSNDGLPFSGLQGAVLTLDVKADEAIAGTTAKIKLTDMELVGTDGVTSYNPSDASTKVTVRNLSYTLTYMLDGEVYEKDTVEYGTPISPLPEPTKEGYTFSGWSEIPEIMPAEDIVIMGTFSANSFKLTYIVDGDVYYADTLLYGSKTPTLIEPVKEGYTFSGWSELPATMPANDVTVTGSFAVNTYKITYTVDGEVHATDSIAYGTALTAIDAPTKEGHTFSGWSELPATMPAKDVTITGSFAVNTYKITYTVDGEVHATDSIAYGTALTAIDAPTKEGHTFSGWSELPATMPAKDVTITGSFAVNTYKITYTIDGEVHATDSVAYGTALTAIDAPTKEGHTFSGWSELPATMPANDVTITGSFAVNTYKITYTVDGEVHATDSIAYGTALTAIDAPTKEGHTFSGWSELPATMPANDVTVTGTFILNKAQTDAQGLVYELNQADDGFELSNHTSPLSEELVVPSELYGMPVTALRDRALMGADEMKSIVIPESVTSVGSRAFYACHNLLLVEWNAKAAIEATCFEAPNRYGNMLVFVSDTQTEINYEGNVIVDGVSDKIVLTDGMPLRNPREFTAREVTYTHEFTKRTKIGEAGGWEALVLPFDVQTVTSEKKGTLLPFGRADYTTSLPYWAAALQTDGTFAIIDDIKANTPFIMEVPNGEEYEDRYNVEGEVTFSSTDVTVYPTTGMEQEEGAGYVMRGSYEGTAADSRIYALNDEGYVADSETYLPGGVFVANSRDIRPFEAYIYSENGGRAPYLRINGKDTGIGYTLMSTDKDTWYTLQGIRLSGKPQERGVYIYNGRKVMVK